MTNEADEKPTIDLSENRVAHNKTYTEPSLRKAIQAYARREGLTDSEAGRQLWLIAFCDKNVFGGYKTKGLPPRIHSNESM
jgi:hypothetical protein